VTSLRQIAANQRNALRSTGPTTTEGKRRSRRNALRHGLYAETVVDGIKDTEDYRAFEAAIIADYEARTAVERELVLRLASLLWRLRRATAIETDLLRIQAEMLVSRNPPRGLSGNRSVSAVVHDLPLASTEIKSNELTIGSVEPFGKVTGASGDRRQMTHTFQRLPTSPTEFHPAPQHRIARVKFLWPSTRSSCRSKPQDRPFAA
jgi:hypothetical protein